MTQQELAVQAKTKQPAIARLESGRHAVSTRTMERVAEALDATLRIYIEPSELIGREKVRAAWWERPTAWEVLEQPLLTAAVVHNLTVHNNVAFSPSDPDDWPLASLAQTRWTMDLDLQPVAAPSASDSRPAEAS